MYECLVFFRDLQDKSYEYRPGDIFPRSGLEVSDARLEELSTNKNRRGKPVIALVEVKEVATEVVDEKAEETETVEVPVEAPKPKRGRKKKNAD